MLGRMWRKLEKVQRCEIRMTKGLEGKLYEEKLRKLGMERSRLGEKDI